MSLIVSLIAVVVLLVLAAALNAAGLQVLLGVFLPYAALAVFIGGFIWKVVGWAKSPVPFRIPTTCGQEDSLDWIKPNRFDNPSTTGGVIVRMLLEVFAFRSLFRNTTTNVRDDMKVAYTFNPTLWLAGLMFHYALLVIVVRHLRLFVSKVPAPIQLMESLDGFIQLTLPTFYMSDAVIVLAATYLFIRRVVVPQVKYISLAADYFPLILIFSIAITGILMRYFTKVDIVSVKALVSGLFSFKPVVPEGNYLIFYMHLFLVSSLMMYFPFSKLMHMGGVFMSPTRNLANNSRVERHINPWNPDIKIHTYMEYEDDFRKAMKSVGLPLEKDVEDDK